MLVTPDVAMHPQPLQPRGELGIVRRDHAAVAGAAEVFRREEAEAAHRAEHSRLTAAIGAADRLRRVFNDRQAIPHRRSPQGVHVGALAEQVDWHDGPRPRGHRSIDGRGVEIERRGVNVDENGLRADPVNATGRRKEGVRGGDDFVARADIEGHQRQNKCVGTRGTPDRMAGVAERRDLLFELDDVVAEDEFLSGQHAVHDRTHFVSDFVVLLDQVDQRNGGSRERSRGKRQNIPVHACESLRL